MSASPRPRPTSTSSPEGWLRGYLNDEGNALLDRALQDYAHELAEKIRNAPFEDHLLQQHQLARAAQIIDPEVP